MLKQETIAKLAALAKVKTEDLQAAIKDEKEVDVTIDDKLSTFTEAELTTLKDNELKRGKVSAVEIAVKDAKEKLGLDFQGKTIDGLIEAANKKAMADSKIEPDKKVQELNEKIVNLQKTVGEQEQKLNEKEKEVTGVKINGELYKHVPSFGDNGPALGADDVIAMMQRGGYEFKLNDSGKVIALKDGKELLDKTSNSKPVNEIISEFMKEKKLIVETPGGRGGKDQKPAATITKLSQLKQQFIDQGKSTIGQEFMQTAQKLAADNKEFDMEG